MSERSLPKATAAPALRRATPASIAATPDGAAPSIREASDPTKRLLTVQEVGKQLQVSRYTIWRLGREGKFPSPVHIGSRSRWRQSDIDTWIEGQAAAPAAEHRA